MKKSLMDRWEHDACDLHMTYGNSNMTRDRTASIMLAPMNNTIEIKMQEDMTQIPQQQGESRPYAKRKRGQSLPCPRNALSIASICNPMSYDPEVILQSDSTFYPNFGVFETLNERCPKRRRKDSPNPLRNRSQSDPRGNRMSPTVERRVGEVLARTKLNPEDMVNLLMEKTDKRKLMEQSGYSHNYLMKLQRKVLHSSKSLQLKPADVVFVGNLPLHVLYSADQTPLVIKKELCSILDMKGTTFSYWKKKSRVDKLDTSQSFRLMDQCRKIFGGRSTYVLFTVADTIKILDNMQQFRHRASPNLQELRDFLARL